MKWIIYWLLPLLFAPAYAQSWQAELLLSGRGVLWGMAVIDEQRILVTERHGQVGILNHHTGQYRVIFDFPHVLAKGQGGLLDVAKSPFDAHRYYFSYSRDLPTGIETVLASASLVENKLVNLEDIFVSYSGSSTGRHFGSRITFDERYVYFSIGDRGQRANGQNKQTHAGSILRLLPDGSVPDSNPFVSEGKNASAIWSYGHRNPQGLFYDSATNQLWSVEHGPRGGDEINLIEQGNNYGWPVTSHGKEYWGPLDVGEAKEMPGIHSPTQVYVPSIAPSSLLIYRGERYPELNGKLIIGALKLTHINVIELSENGAVQESRIVEELGERVRALIVTPDDKLLFSTDSGKLYFLQPNSG